MRTNIIISFIISTLLSFASASTRITIYDGSTSFLFSFPFTQIPNTKGVRILENGAPVGWGHFTKKTTAKKVTYYFVQTLDFFETRFQRKSFDNNNTPVIAIINYGRHLKSLDFNGFRGNTTWIPSQKLFVFGANNNGLGNFTNHLDIIAHEFTHAVISHTTKLKEEGQSGAIAEHLGDVFGLAIKHYYQPQSDPFAFGENVVLSQTTSETFALRNLADPHKSYFRQPAHMEEYPSEFDFGCKPSLDNDFCGVHLINGILNRSAAIIISSLGWERSIPLYYKVMTERLKPHSDFVAYKNKMLEECTQLLSPEECHIFDSAFASVGL